MKIREDNDFKPLCPHCNIQLDETVAVLHGHVRRHYVYCCPHCRKVIGFSQGAR